MLLQHENSFRAQSRHQPEAGATKNSDDSGTAAENTHSQNYTEKA